MLRHEWTWIAKPLLATDGDTFTCIIDRGFDDSSKRSIRVANVQCPEEGQAGYQEAKDFLQEWLNDAIILSEGITLWPITLKTYKLKVKQELDRSFNRYVADVYRTEDDVSLSNAILEAGVGILWQP